MAKIITKKIILVDAYPVVLNGLKAMLHDMKNIKIAAETSNEKEAMLMLPDKSPDLIITGLSMPEMNGIELTKHIKEKYPDIKILIFAECYESEILKKALFSGADACLLKSSSKEKLHKAINKVLENENYYDNDIPGTARDLQELNKPRGTLASISKRELEIFELLLKGLSNKEIAKKLTISYNTVGTHRKNIMKKTNSRNISGLFKFAMDNKLFLYKPFDVFTK